jgi:hypothetical protein
LTGCVRHRPHGGRVERQSTFTREYFGGLNQSARAAIGVGPSAATMEWPPALPLAPLLRAVHSMSSRSQVPHAAQPSARLDGVLVFAEWLAYRQADVRDPVWRRPPPPLHQHLDALAAPSCRHRPELVCRRGR